MDGSGGYKGKAEGSNSSEGLWIANLTGEPLDKASEIVWFESAYDAMAEYQINPVKMVYVSTGGTPTEGQMRGLLSVTPNARHYLGFDKDDAGRQFVANFRKVAAEMGFRHEHVQAIIHWLLQGLERCAAQQEISRTDCQGRTRYLRLCRVYRSRQGRETKGKRRKEHIS